MKILSWNSRGLGHPSKVSALREIIHCEKLEILLIQESKQDQQEMRGIIDQQKQYKGSIIESRGASRGIATLWNHSKWNCTSEKLHQHWIRIVLENRIDNQTTIIYNVYAPNHFREKECCWDDLKASIDGEINSNIIVGGDFNLILHANEK